MARLVGPRPTWVLSCFTACEPPKKPVSSFERFSSLGQNLGFVLFCSLRASQEAFFQAFLKSRRETLVPPTLSKAKKGRPRAGGQKRLPRSVFKEGLHKDKNRVIFSEMPMSDLRPGGLHFRVRKQPKKADLAPEAKKGSRGAFSKKDLTKTISNEMPGFWN